MSRRLPPLHVATLGCLRIEQAGVPLPESRWGRGKALELLLYFVTHPNELRHRERIADDLWPERDREGQERDFKAALNALSEALEPERPARTATGYVSRQGQSYGLAPEAPWDIDYLRFEAEVLEAGRLEEPGAASRKLRAALERYRGDFLPGYLAKDWTAATRERLQGLFLTAATALARHLAAEGQYGEALALCRRVIAADPLWEEAHRILMACHLGAGNRPLAVQAYRGFARDLEATLGLEPMQETKNLYRVALEEL